ncbi:hypothetical protein D6833_02955 [Candidatus Parcubacteria bacterium]|nr:MAG: hypothetical protein D6833_02955 [Candidatus Parcubacteria bacterium]
MFWDTDESLTETFVDTVWGAYSVAQYKGKYWWRFPSYTFVDANWWETNLMVDDDMCRVWEPESFMYTTSDVKLVEALAVGAFLSARDNIRNYADANRETGLRWSATFTFHVQEPFSDLLDAYHEKCADRLLRSRKVTKTEFLNTLLLWGLWDELRQYGFDLLACKGDGPNVYDILFTSRIDFRLSTSWTVHDTNSAGAGIVLVNPALELEFDRTLQSKPYTLYSVIIIKSLVGLCLQQLEPHTTTGAFVTRMLAKGLAFIDFLEKRGILDHVLDW